MVIYDTTDDGEVIILFDSRWQFPELLGYKPEDPQYKLLRKLWEEATKEADAEEPTIKESEALLPTD